MSNRRRDVFLTLSVCLQRRRSQACGWLASFELIGWQDSVGRDCGRACQGKNAYTDETDFHHLLL
jgi:hypothetical protein